MTMNIDDIKPVLEQFTKSADDKIDAALERVKTLESEANKLQSDVIEIAKKAHRHWRSDRLYQSDS